MSIEAEEVHVGKGVRIGKNVQINGGFNYKLNKAVPAKKVIIGDGVFIGNNVQLESTEIKLGDYTMLRDDVIMNGGGKGHLGSCCWIGEKVILNTTGDLFMGNGVGVGTGSQLWTHIRFGDTLQGCNWYSDKPLVIEDDVWFVGHCLVSPIHAKKKSMAMLGSVVTKDMEENHIYAGTPAKDITDKIGYQYKEVSVNEKFEVMQKKLDDFYRRYPDYPKTIVIVKNTPKKKMKDKTVFNVSNRTYTKRLTEEEIEFMKFLLVPIKFYPSD